MKNLVAIVLLILGCVLALLAGLEVVDEVIQFTAFAVACIAAALAVDHLP